MLIRLNEDRTPIARAAWTAGTAKTPHRCEDPHRKDCTDRTPIAHATTMDNDEAITMPTRGKHIVFPIIRSMSVLVISSAHLKCVSFNYGWKPDRRIICGTSKYFAADGTNMPVHP